MNKCVKFFSLLTIFPMTALPVLADPFAGMFEEGGHSLSEGRVAVQYQDSNGRVDVFDSALKAFVDVDTSSVDVEIAEAESLSEEQAYNVDVLWESSIGLQRMRVTDRFSSVSETIDDKLLSTSLTLNKKLWDKSIDYSIESAKNNIQTAKINQFESQNELIESVAIAYLDYLAAKDLVVSTQQRNALFLSLRDKVDAAKKADDELDIDMDEVERQVRSAQASLFDEGVDLRKAKIKLSQLTNGDSSYMNAGQSYFSENSAISLKSEALLIRTAMRNNTGLLAARSNAVTLQKGVMAERAGGDPKLDFTSSISQEWSASDEGENVFDVSVGINMEVPLYTGGRIENKVKLAKLELLSASREANQQKREIIADIGTLAAEFSGELSSYQSLLKLHKKAKKSAAEAKAAIAANEIDSIGLFDDLDSEVELKNSLIRGYYDLLKIKVEIMKITGDLSTVNLNQLRGLLLAQRS